jgi:hypothetical protein
LTCQDAAALRSAAAADALTAIDQAALDRHAAGCAACRRLVDEPDLLLAELGAWSIDPPTLAAADITAAVRAQGDGPPLLQLLNLLRRVEWGAVAVLTLCAIVTAQTFVPETRFRLADFRVRPELEQASATLGSQLAERAPGSRVLLIVSPTQDGREDSVDTIVAGLNRGFDGRLAIHAIAAPHAPASRRLLGRSQQPLTRDAFWTIAGSYRDCDLVICADGAPPLGGGARFTRIAAIGDGAAELAGAVARGHVDAAVYAPPARLACWPFNRQPRPVELFTAP